MTDLVLGLTACMSRFPVNHHVGFLRELFGETFRKQLYIAIIYLYPPEMVALFSSRWFFPPWFSFHL